MVTPDNLGNQKYLFLMLHRLILKVTKLQLPPPKRLSTVVKNILGGHHAPLLCQIRLNKGLYTRHHCWALDGFKLGGLFPFYSVIKSILFWSLLTFYCIYFYLIITYICCCFLAKRFSVLSWLIYFLQESIIRFDIMGTLFL